MPNSCPRARVWCSQHKLHLNSRPFISVVKRMHSSKVRQRAPWTGNGPSPSSSGFSGNPVWGMVRAEVVRSKQFEAGGGPKKPQLSSALTRREASLLVPSPLVRLLLCPLLIYHVYQMMEVQPASGSAPLFRDPRISSEKPHLPLLS